MKAVCGSESKWKIFEVLSVFIWTWTHKEKRFVFHWQEPIETVRVQSIWKVSCEPTWNLHIHRYEDAAPYPSAQNSPESNTSYPSLSHHHRYEIPILYPYAWRPPDFVSIDTGCFKKPTDSYRLPSIRRRFFQLLKIDPEEDRCEGTL